MFITITIIKTFVITIIANITVITCSIIIVFIIVIIIIIIIIIIAALVLLIIVITHLSVSKREKSLGGP